MTNPTLPLLSALVAALVALAPAAGLAGPNQAGPDHGHPDAPRHRHDDRCAGPGHDQALLVEALHHDHQHALDEIAVLLRDIQGAVRDSRDKDLMAAVHDRMGLIDGLVVDAQRLSDDLARTALTPVVVAVAEVPPPPEAGPEAMSDAEFRRILAAVKSESFDDERMAILESASAGRWFSSDQVKQLMGSFTFGRDQIRTGVLLFPQVVDHDNWWTVYDVLTFDSERKKLREQTR